MQCMNLLKINDLELLSQVKGPAEPERRDRDEKSHAQAWLFKMAGSTGLEPAASGVTGRRYNHLNYDPIIHFVEQKRETDLPQKTLVGETGIEPVTSSL